MWYSACITEDPNLCHVREDLDMLPYKQNKEEKHRLIAMMVQIIRLSLGGRRKLGREDCGESESWTGRLATQDGKIMCKPHRPRRGGSELVTGIGQLHEHRVAHLLTACLITEGQLSFE